MSKPSTRKMLEHFAGVFKSGETACGNLLGDVVVMKSKTKRDLTSYAILYGPGSTMVEEASSDEFIVVPMKGFFADLEWQTDITVDGVELSVHPSTETVWCRHAYAEELQRIATHAPRFAYSSAAIRNPRVSFTVPGALLGLSASASAERLMWEFNITGGKDLCVRAFSDTTFLYGLLVYGVIDG